MDGIFSDGRISSRNFFSETKLHPGVDSARSKALSNSTSAGCTRTPGLVVVWETSFPAAFAALGKLSPCREVPVGDAVFSGAAGSSQNCIRPFSGAHVPAPALLGCL